MQYKYLTEADIIELNEYQIQTYSPHEPIGVVQSSALNMIVNLPQQSFYGIEAYPNIQTKSAVLFRTIAKKHVFINANKRTALIALDVFLDMNGYKLNIERNEGLEYTVAVVTDDIELNDIGFWIDANISEKE